MISRVKVLGVGVSVVSLSAALSYVEKRLGDGEKFFVTTPNPEILLMAHADDAYAKILNSSDLALPDGVGLVLASGGKISRRVSGVDMLEELIKRAKNEGYKLYFLGGESGVAEKMVKVACGKYGLKSSQVCGNSGILVNNEGKVDRKKGIDSGCHVIGDINKFRPDMLFVAFGAPKQERWVARNISKLNIGGVMVVGGSFDFLVGKVRRASRVVRMIGFEWLWRLLIQPRRVGRIFRAVVVFPLVVLKDKLRV